MNELPLPPPWPEETATPTQRRDLSDFWRYLMALGFGMAASRNPSGIGRIGEGGMAALSNMLDLEKMSELNRLRERSLQSEENYRNQSLDLRREELNVQQPYREALATYYNAMAQRALRNPEAGNRQNDLFTRAFGLIENVNKNYENLISRESQKLSDPLLSPEQRAAITARLQALEAEKNSRLTRLYNFYARIMPPELREEFEAIFGPGQQTPASQGPRIIPYVPPSR